MTGLLTDVMHERAEALDAAAPDVDAIISAAERRVARRRTTWAAGGVAAAVVLAVVAPLTLDGGGSADRGASPAEGFTQGEIVYALDSTIHAGPHTIDAGAPVAQLATTEHGVVFADDEGRVWSSTGGRPEQVGQVSKATLAEGVPIIYGDGDLAAWLDDRAQGPVINVVDQATGQTHRLGALEGEEAVDARDLVALDDGTVHFQDSGGPDRLRMIAWTPATGEIEVLGADTPALEWIFDVKNGVFLYDPALGDSTTVGGSDLLRVGRGLTGGIDVDVDAARLSPDGAHLLARVDGEHAVIETATGRRLPFGDLGSTFLHGRYWLDEETYVAIGKQTEDAGGEVLRCDLSGDCEREVTLPTDARTALPSSS